MWRACQVKPSLAAQRRGQADHGRAVFHVLWQQGRSWSQAFRQQQDLVPPGPRRFLVVHRYRGIPMARPGDEILVGLTTMLGNWDVRNLFDI